MKTIKVTEQDTMGDTLNLIGTHAAGLGLEEGEEVAVQIYVLSNAFTTLYGTMEEGRLVLGSSGSTCVEYYDSTLWGFLDDILLRYADLNVELVDVGLLGKHLVGFGCCNGRG